MTKQQRRRDAEYYQSKGCWKPSTLQHSAGGWVYAVQEIGAPLIRIGATKNPRLASRLTSLRWSIKEPHRLIAAGYVSYWVHTVEHYIHWRYRNQRIVHDWFYLCLSSREFYTLIQQATVAVAEKKAQLQRHYPACVLLSFVPEDLDNSSCCPHESCPGCLYEGVPHV